MSNNVGTYIAGRFSLPDRSARWRHLRDVDGYKITCSWIDEEVSWRNSDFHSSWHRTKSEIESSELLILYLEPDDVPLKQVPVEVSMALTSLIPVRIVTNGVKLDPACYSFNVLASYPMVQWYETIDKALEGVTLCL